MAKRPARTAVFAKDGIAGQASFLSNILGSLLLFGQSIACIRGDGADFFSWGYLGVVDGRVGCGVLHHGCVR